MGLTVRRGRGPQQVPGTEGKVEMPTSVHGGRMGSQRGQHWGRQESEGARGLGPMVRVAAPEWAAFGAEHLVPG